MDPGHCAEFKMASGKCAFLDLAAILDAGQRRLEALPGMHCNSLILSISRDAPSLFD